MLPVWPIIFSVNIVQSLFLISLLVIRGSRNVLASRMIIVLLVLMIMSNAGDLVPSTELGSVVPELFILSFGGMWCFGPLFYLYSRAIVDPAFKWRHIYWMHFLPALCQWGLNIYLLTSLDHELWLKFVGWFVEGGLPIQLRDKILVALQVIQLSIYLALTMRWTQRIKNNMRNAPFVISISQRIKWLNTFAIGFIVFLMTIVIFYFVVFVQGYNDPVSNYAYTLVTSLIVFTLAYKMTLSPGLLSPDFAQKYQAYMQFEGDEGKRYVEKIRELMESKRVFADPDLSLTKFAEQLSLPAHQVSKLVNEKFGKSFTDLVNEYRVEEFITRMNDPKYRSYSLFGIALEVGFSSKSAFNTAFKKITGKTPSEFKV